MRPPWFRADISWRRIRTAYLFGQLCRICFIKTTSADTGCGSKIEVMRPEGDAVAHVPGQIRVELGLEPWEIRHIELQVGVLARQEHRESAIEAADLQDMLAIMR